MTDKQIIIDGVDVSQCNYYADGKCTNSQMIQSNCKNVAICYYKEYKRKEQECETLASQLDFEVQKKECLEQECEELKAMQKDLSYENQKFCYQIEEQTKQLDQLKAENEILKEKFEIAIKNNMDKTLLRLEKGDVQEELQEIREQFGIETLYCHVDNTRVHRCLDVLKLKDTLTEIKEIAMGIMDDDLEESSAYYDAKRILQKISEVEDETTK